MDRQELAASLLPSFLHPHVTTQDDRSRAVEKAYQAADAFLAHHAGDALVIYNRHDPVYLDLFLKEVQRGYLNVVEADGKLTIPVHDILRAIQVCRVPTGEQSSDDNPSKANREPIGAPGSLPGELRHTGGH